MPGRLNGREEKALIATLLDLDQERESVDNFTVIAHVHREGEACTGLMKIYSNCDVEFTKNLIKSAGENIGKGNQ